MKYQTMRSFYHAIGSHDYMEELESRKNSHQTILFPIYIRDHKAAVENQAFMVCDWEMISLMESFARHISSISELSGRLPDAAMFYYTRKCLIDEIQTTNDIEGIFSTRMEVNETIQAVSENASGKKKRFMGMVRKYVLLLIGQYNIPLNTNADIRALYDDIVKDEIPIEQHPDGMLYRKSSVAVVSKTGQIRHKGLMGEECIIQAMEQCLNILHDAELPLLIRTALFHYFFGYIHPFYDGNGRTNRFISSCLLYNISPLVSLSLSRILKENKSAYYKSFQICNDAKNAGDITPFVISFLSFIDLAAESVVTQLTDGKLKLAYYHEGIHNIRFACDSKAKAVETKIDLLLCFIQNALFLDEGLVMKDLVKYSRLSRTTVYNLVHSMIEEDGIPIRITDGKPKTYKIDLDEFDVFLSKQMP